MCEWPKVTQPVSMTQWGAELCLILCFNFRHRTTERNINRQHLQLKGQVVDLKNSLSTNVSTPTAPTADFENNSWISHLDREISL